MGLQIFSSRSWEEDSFNETNVTSVLRNSREMAGSRAMEEKTMGDVMQNEDLDKVRNLVREIRYLREHIVGIHQDIGTMEKTPTIKGHLGINGFIGIEVDRDTTVLLFKQVLLDKTERLREIENQLDKINLLL